MGGMGSGRNAFNNSTQEMRSVDVRELQRCSSLASAARFLYKWPGEGKVMADAQVACCGRTVSITYRVKEASGRWRETNFNIVLVWSKCYFGGGRPFFICPLPGCQRRSAILYFGKHLSCRVCQRLSYPCQRIRPEDRALARAQAFRVKLGGSVDISLPFPPKPKGMDTRRYIRLSLKAFKALDQANNEVIEWAKAVRERQVRNS